jgi:hypothetical protein
MLSTRRKFFPNLLGFSLASATLFSREGAAADCSGSKNTPGQFNLNNRSYVLDPNAAGIIVDGFKLCPSGDDGSRTINFGKELVIRKGYIDVIDDFNGLEPGERYEVINIAIAAVKYIETQKKRHAVRPIDSGHEQKLIKFLETVPMMDWAPVPDKLFPVLKKYSKDYSLK